MAKCRYCNAELAWIKSVNNKMVPCEAKPIMRQGSEVPPDGRYFDAKGNFWQPADVPCKVEVWRSHWASCSGAAQARRK